MGAKGGEGSLEDGKLGGEFRLVGASEGSAVCGAGLGVLGAPVEGGEANTAAHFGGSSIDGMVEELAVGRLYGDA